VKRVKIGDVADFLGVTKADLVGLVRAERLTTTGKGDGKVLLSETVRVLGLPKCPTCGQLIDGSK